MGDLRQEMIMEERIVLFSLRLHWQECRLLDLDKRRQRNSLRELIELASRELQLLRQNGIEHDGIPEQARPHVDNPLVTGRGNTMPVSSTSSIPWTGRVLTSPRTCDSRCWLGWPLSTSRQAAPVVRRTYYKELVMPYTRCK